MRVTVTFVDGEVLAGDTEAGALTAIGLPLMSEAGPEHVALGFIKHVRIEAPASEVGLPADPREGRGLRRVSVGFVDGTAMTTYDDSSYRSDAYAIRFRIWSPEKSCLVEYWAPFTSLRGLRVNDLAGSVGSARAASA